MVMVVGLAWLMCLEVYWVMMYPLFFTPSLFVLVFSMLMSLSAVNPLVVWLGMVLNLIAMVGLFSGANSMGQSAMVYFLVQSISSTLFIFPAGLSALDIYVWEDLMVFGLLVKMGVAPFHFWVMPAFLGSDWVIIFLLSGVQKIIPLGVLSSLGDIKSFVLVFGGLSVLVGGFGAIKSGSLKVLFAYSSVSHSGWMVVLAGYSYWLGMCYVVIYSLSLFPLALTFMVLRPKSVALESQLNSVSVIRLVLAIASLSGLPPFMGFMTKLMVSVEVTGSLGESLVLVPLFFGSCLNLFAYLVLLFKVSVVLPHPKPMIFSRRQADTWWHGLFIDVIVVGVLTLTPMLFLGLAFF